MPKSNQQLYVDILNAIPSLKRTCLANANATLVPSPSQSSLPASLVFGVNVAVRDGS